MLIVAGAVLRDAAGVQCWRRRRISRAACGSASGSSPG